MVDLTQVIVAFLTLVFSLVSVYLIPLLKSKVSGEQLETIKFWVNIAVEAAEMIYVGKGKGAFRRSRVRSSPSPPECANPNPMFFVKHCFGFVLTIEEV